ncbi:MAG: hypothetical protein LBC02_05915 [Planctomycetaceae bacterium]|jgi:hypothetical protein|nr:hypothetical protein [Planctomycetaceae bacterium]
MSDKIVSSLFSALVGGIVGACVVFFLSGKTKFDSLEVGSLKITKQATLLNTEGKDDVVIKDGSVLANNVILGKKFIAQQYQGHVFVGNRMFTSPDNLMEKPMDQWKFFTEIGSSDTIGGELIVRSPHGANVVGQPVNTGTLFRIGFDEGSDSPRAFARSNENGGILHVGFLAPRQQPGAETPPENGAVAPAPATPPASAETSSVPPITAAPPAANVATDNTGNATK